MLSDVVREGLYKSKLQDSSFRLSWLCTIKKPLETMDEVVDRGAVIKSQQGQKANVERKVEECFQWKAHGQYSKGDSCSFSRDRLVQETCTMVRDEKDDRLLPHQNRRERKILKKKHQATEKKALQTKRTKFRAVTQILKTRHVNFGILPCVKATSLRPDVNLEEHVASDMLRLRRSPARSQFKVVRKDQLHH